MLDRKAAENNWSIWWGVGYFGTVALPASALEIAVVGRRERGCYTPRRTGPGTPSRPIHLTDSIRRSGCTVGPGGHRRR